MTGVVAAPCARDDTRPTAAGTPVELGIEDSLRFLGRPVQPVPVAMVAVFIGSLAFHALIVATALITTRTLLTVPQREIPIDLVQDAPKPAARTPRAVQPQSAKPKEGPNDIEALQKELAALRAQRAALQTASASRTEARDVGPMVGPMAKSSRAVALPSIGENGEVVGYQDLVFSRLARAKGTEDYHGEAGTTGVRFELDMTGRLVSADVAVSSGNPTLDRQALEIVRRAAPFPPPPKGADHSFFANVNFVPPAP